MYQPCKPVAAMVVVALLTAHHAQAQTSRPTTASSRPGRVEVIDELAILASPGEAEFAPSNNAQVNALLNQYNTQQAKLKKVLLAGECEWTTAGAAPKQGRPLRIEFDRPAGRAQVQCATERCIVEGSTIHSYQGDARGAMRVDALYLLMFRKFNPQDFESIADETLARTDRAGQKIDAPVKALKSPAQTLRFEGASGRLLEAEFVIDQGVVVIDFDDFKTIDDGVSLPMSVSVRPPRTLWRTQVPENPMVRLTIDPTTVGVTAR